MQADPVARAYAEALLGIAEDRGMRDAIGEQLQAFVGVLEAAPEVDAFLRSPLVDAAAKKGVLERALAGKMEALVVDFLCLLVDKRRIDAMREIAKVYQGLADEHAGRVRVEAVTAVPLSADLAEELRRLVNARGAGECVLEARVRPELLGGLVFRVRDTVYDGSVRHQLQKLQQEIVRSSGYEN